MSNAPRQRKGTRPVSVCATTVNNILSARADCRTHELRLMAPAMVVVIEKDAPPRIEVANVHTHGDAAALQEYLDTDELALTVRAAFFENAQDDPVANDRRAEYRKRLDQGRILSSLTVRPQPRSFRLHEPQGGLQMHTTNPISQAGDEAGTSAGETDARGTPLLAGSYAPGDGAARCPETPWTGRWHAGLRTLRGRKAVNVTPFLSTDRCHHRGAPQRKRLRETWQLPASTARGVKEFGEGGDGRLRPGDHLAGGHDPRSTCVRQGLGRAADRWAEKRYVGLYREQLRERAASAMTAHAATLRPDDWDSGCGSQFGLTTSCRIGAASTAGQQPTHQGQE